MPLRRFLAAVFLMFFAVNAAAETGPEYRVVRVADATVLLRRLNELGAQGFRAVAAVLDRRSDTPHVVLRRNAAHKYEYLLTVGGKGFSERLNAAGQLGYRVRAELIFAPANESSTRVPMLLERVDTTEKKYEYRVIKPIMVAKIPLLTFEAVNAGFVPVAQYWYGGIWEHEIGASAPNASIEAKLIKTSSNIEKVAQRMTKDGEAGYRVGYCCIGQPVMLRNKTEARKFAYRPIMSKKAEDFEQRIALARAEGFAVVPGTFAAEMDRAHPDTFFVLMERTGETAAAVKYTLQQACENLFSETRADLLQTSATGDGAIWYLLANAQTRASCKPRLSAPLSGVTRIVELRRHQQIAFAADDFAVIEKKAQLTVRREDLVEALYLRGGAIPTPDGQGGAPMCCAAPGSGGAGMELLLLGFWGISKVLPDGGPDEHLVLVYRSGDTEIGRAFDISKNELPDLNSAFSEFAGPKFLDLTMTEGAQ